MKGNMENFDYILKQGLMKFHKKNYSKIKGPCLTDNEMASMLDGLTPATKQDTLFEHLLSCEKCFMELKSGLADLEYFEKEGILKPPEEVIQAAINLVKPKETVRRLPAYLSMPLEISDLSVTCFEMARAGRTTRPRPKTIKKISFVPSADGFVYLFQVGRKKVAVVLQKQKVFKGIKDELIGKIEKPLAKKKGLVLILTKTPFKDISPIKNILLKTLGKGSEKGLEMLEKTMSERNAAFKLL